FIESILSVWLSGRESLRGRVTSTSIHWYRERLIRREEPIRDRKQSYPFAVVRHARRARYLDPAMCGNRVSPHSDQNALGVPAIRHDRRAVRDRSRATAAFPVPKTAGADGIPWDQPPCTSSPVGVP